MAVNILQDITGYIDFLRECGYSVMVSCFGDRFMPCLPTMLTYEVHILPICSYLKSCPQTKGKCICNKKLLCRKQISTPYYSCCYAGVEEYIIPIMHDNMFLLCVNVSGYKGKLEKSQKLRNFMIQKVPDTHSYYQMLSENVPELNKILQMIRPLEYMFSELYQYCRQQNNADTASRRLFGNALRFIYDNFGNPITCQDVAAAVNYSESYLRHIFKQECQMSVSEYINHVRLLEAAALLKRQDCSITAVADKCGFNDPNYFSTAFRKKYGCSPRQYRKKCTQH